MREFPLLTLLPVAHRVSFPLVFEVRLPVLGPTGFLVAQRARLLLAKADRLPEPRIPL